MNAINVKGNERWARAGTFSAKESKESDDDVPLGECDVVGISSITTPSTTTTALWSFR